jgi:hypothetical protein
MLYNVSYNNKEIKDAINEAVGNPFTLKERLKLGGIGSQRFIISDASPRILALLELDNNLNYCNIEIRSEGIIIRFRSILETYAWIVPFRSMSVFKSQNEYSFYSDDLYLKLLPAYNDKIKQTFFRKLMKTKADYARRYALPNML